MDDYKAQRKSHQTIWERESRWNYPSQTRHALKPFEILKDDEI